MGPDRSVAPVRLPPGPVISLGLAPASRGSPRQERTFGAAGGPSCVFCFVLPEGSRTFPSRPAVGQGADDPGLGPVGHRPRRRSEGLAGAE